MKTIFDYNPTKAELKELFSFDESNKTMAYGFSIIPLPVDDYQKNTSNEEKTLDLALLFELRDENAEAKKLWFNIPEIERQYRGGFDYEIKPR